MKLLKKISVLYVALLVSFTVLIFAAFAIPTSLVRGNIAESARQIEKEGLWFQPLGFYLFQIDNMTDCLMMHIDAYADSRHPVRAAMLAENAKFDANGIQDSYLNVASTTLAVAENGRGAFADKNLYARYWHGYQVLLRPLLCVFSYNQIRVINYVALTILFLAVIMMLHRRLGAVYSVTFTGAMVLSNVMIVPLAIQFSTCFYIALTAMLLFLVKPRLADDGDKPVLIFFAIGAVTSYADFLTTPLLTLGLPLVLTAALSERNGRSLSALLRNSVAWAFGYVLLWASKWVLAWLLGGYDRMFADAMENVGRRMSDTIVFGGVEMPLNSFFSIIIDKMSAYVSPLLILLTIFAAVALFAVYVFRYRHHLGQNGWTLVVALLPLLWFAVAKNHSLQHIFFTWRDWILTLWCVLLFATLNYKTRKNENRHTDTVLQ